MPNLGFGRLETNSSTWATGGSLALSGLRASRLLAKPVSTTLLAETLTERGVLAILIGRPPAGETLENTASGAIAVTKKMLASIAENREYAKESKNGPFKECVVKLEGQIPELNTRLVHGY